VAFDFSASLDYSLTSQSARSLQVPPGNRQIIVPPPTSGIFRVHHCQNFPAISEVDVSGIRAPSYFTSPPVAQSLVLSHGGQIFLARMLVNEAEDECQHDRTLLFDRVDCERIRSKFQDVFAQPRKWLRLATKLFRGHRRMK
jgi:hypothetical protein